MIIGKKTSRILDNIRFSSNFSLIKKTGGNYINGIYQEGTPLVIQLTGHHQISNDDDRQNLPENSRLLESRKFYIKTNDKDLIRPMRYGINNSSGDIILLDGLNYEVYFVDNYSYNCHITAITVRQENQSD